MIKSILVALDPDSETPVAIRFAADIARRYDAEVVGLAVVDTGHIEADARGGGIGSMYYAEKLRENLTEETTREAERLIREFDAELERIGVPHVNSVKEGVPFRRIVEGMKYHDLLIVGRTPHFFYGHPEQKTRTLARVVKETTAPTFVVGDTYSEIRRVMIAFDGSSAAARTAQYFAHLKPFGDELTIDMVHVHSGNEKESDLMLGLLGSYLEKHGMRTRRTSMRGDDPARKISDYARESGADVVVAGAHSVSKIKELAFGSTTARLLEKCPKAMFLHH